MIFFKYVSLINTKRIKLNQENAAKTCNRTLFFEDAETGQALTGLNMERHTDMLIQIFPEAWEDFDSDAIFQWNH